MCTEKLLMLALVPNKRDEQNVKDFGFEKRDYEVTQLNLSHADPM